MDPNTTIKIMGNSSANTTEVGLRSVASRLYFDRMMTALIWLKPGRIPQRYALYRLKKLPILSFRNFASSGLLAAPAVCPHNDGMGLNNTWGINADSYVASPMGK